MKRKNYSKMSFGELMIASSEEAAAIARGDLSEAAEGRTTIAVTLNSGGPLHEAAPIGAGSPLELASNCHTRSSNTSGVNGFCKNGVDSGGPPRLKMSLGG
jgi:hypothetical protein